MTGGQKGDGVSVNSVTEPTKMPALPALGLSSTPRPPIAACFSRCNRSLIERVPGVAFDSSTRSVIERPWIIAGFSTGLGGMV